MKYWLLKSEPNCYSIEDLQREKKQTSPWEGVRNYQARNFMRDEMRKGDLAFFYHSSCPTPGVVGVVEVVRESYPDHTAFDPKDRHYDPKSTKDNPRWFMVDVQFQKQFPEIITLQQLKAHPGLKDLQILKKGNRLSITPVSADDWKLIMGLAK